MSKLDDQNIAYQEFLNKKHEQLGETPGQFYPYNLENLFADECEKIAQGLIYEKFSDSEGAARLIGLYKAYKETKNDLN